MPEFETGNRDKEEIDALKKLGVPVAVADEKGVTAKATVVLAQRKIVTRGDLEKYVATYPGELARALVTAGVPAITIGRVLKGLPEMKTYKADKTKKTKKSPEKPSGEKFPSKDFVGQERYIDAMRADEMHDWVVPYLNAGLFTRGISAGWRSRVAIPPKTAVELTGLVPLGVEYDALVKMDQEGKYIMYDTDGGGSLSYGSENLPWPFQKRLLEAVQKRVKEEKDAYARLKEKKKGSKAVTLTRVTAPSRTEKDLDVLITQLNLREEGFIRTGRGWKYLPQEMSDELRPKSVKIVVRPYDKKKSHVSVSMRGMEVNGKKSDDSVLEYSFALDGIPGGLPDDGDVGSMLKNMAGLKDSHGFEITKKEVDGNTVVEYTTRK